VKRSLLAALLTLVVVLAIAGPALAATPQDIYNDYADNGQLNGTYTNEELQAYLDDPVIQQYGDPATVAALNDVVNQILGQSSSGSGTSSEEDRSTFPFTGAQMGLMAIGAAILLAGGFMLRRTSAD